MGKVMQQILINIFTRGSGGMEKILLRFYLESTFLIVNQHFNAFLNEKRLILYLLPFYYLLNHQIYRNFMSKAYSFRSEPWTSFSKQSDTIFDEDFVKDKLFIFKTTYKPALGIVKFKQMISAVKNKYRLDEQLKIWFPFKNQGSSIYTQIKSDQIKVQYDHGVRQYQNNLINFYGVFQSGRNINNIVLKLGANFLLVDTNFDSRLRVAFKDSEQLEVSSGHKFNWTSQKWTVDVCNVINYRTVSLFSNAFRIIYRLNPQHKFFLKGENNKMREMTNIDFLNLDTYFTNFSVSYVSKVNNLTKIGLQTSFTKNKLLNASVVAQRILQKSNSKIKVKINSEKAISLSYQSQIKDYGRWMVGWQLNYFKNTNKFGVLFDINL